MCLRPRPCEVLGRNRTKRRTHNPNSHGQNAYDTSKLYVGPSLSSSGITDQQLELLQLLLLQAPEALQQVRQWRGAGRAPLAVLQHVGLFGGHQNAHDRLHGQQQGGRHVHHEVGVRDEASSQEKSSHEIGRRAASTGMKWYICKGIIAMPHNVYTTHLAILPI